MAAVADPGLGILTTALVVLLVGMMATNVIGKRILQRAESYLLRVPVFRTIYAPVKQLVVAFSPDNEYGFKRVVLVEDSARGFMLGFLTKEFTVDRGQRTRNRCMRSTCRPITCTSGTSSSVRATGCRSRTSRWSRGSGFFSPAAWRCRAECGWARTNRRRRARARRRGGSGLKSAPDKI